MKKIIALLLAILICFSLCACGGNNTPKKDPAEEQAELIENTPDLDLSTLWLTADSNQALATQTYNKRMFKVKVKVLNIHNTYFEYIYTDNYGRRRSVQVNMPTEVLATLKNGERIMVLGELILTSSSTATINDAFIIDSSNIGTKAFDEATIQEAIANYKPFDSKGNISWSAGSAPFFIDNRLYFEQITADNFLTEVSGEWIGKYYVERNTEYRITFNSDSTASVAKNGAEANEWKYSFSGDLIKFPNNSSVEAREIRKVSDKLIVIYADTVDYVPYWILYKV